MSEVNPSKDLRSIFGLLVRGVDIAEPSSLFRWRNDIDGKAVETVVPKASDLSRFATAWSTNLDIQDIELTLSVALLRASEANVLPDFGMKTGTWNGFCEGVEAYVVGTAIAGKLTEDGAKSAEWLAGQLNDERFRAYIHETYLAIDDRLTQYPEPAMDISDLADYLTAQKSRLMILQAIERDDQKGLGPPRPFLGQAAES